MEANIIIPKKYKFLFKVATEDANHGKIIATKELGMLSSEEVSDDPQGIAPQEYLACKIECKSSQSLFDTGVDFALGIVNERNNIKNQLINN